jgi:hypothetical protein
MSFSDAQERFWREQIVLVLRPIEILSQGKTAAGVSGDREIAAEL